MAKNQKPDLNIALVAIQKAQAQIQKNQGSGFGKVKAFFGTSAQVLDNHNYLFKLLPTGDKYTSVFIGAFSAIVKVGFVSLSRIKLILRTKGNNYTRQNCQ